MLSQKKMIIGVFEFDFLGMHIKDGRYSLQPYVGRELLKITNVDLFKNEVHQFLGIVKYMAGCVDRLFSIIKLLQNMLKKVYHHGLQNKQKQFERLSRKFKDPISVCSH